MPKKGIVTIDSGVFITDESATGNQYSDVGYFAPRIVVYDDKEKVREVTLPVSPRGQIINIAHTDKAGNDLGKGISLSNDLLVHLLRLQNVYGQLLDRSSKLDFEYIFHFNSGHFRSSGVKEREFAEIDPRTYQPTGNKKSVGRIANDILVLYSLADDDVLKFTLNGESVWSSAWDTSIQEHFDVQILADYSSKMKLYCDSVRLGKNTHYWVPNSDPSPSWNHFQP